MGRWPESERAPEERRGRQAPAFSTWIVGGKLEWELTKFGGNGDIKTECQDMNNRRRIRNIPGHQAVIDRSYACGPATAAERGRGKNRDRYL